jgi:hypothetical protein
MTPSVWHLPSDSPRLVHFVKILQLKPCNVRCRLSVGWLSDQRQEVRDRTDRLSFSIILLSKIPTVVFLYPQTLPLFPCLENWLVAASKCLLLVKVPLRSMSLGSRSLCLNSHVQCLAGLEVTVWYRCSAYKEFIKRTGARSSCGADSCRFLPLFSCSSRFARLLRHPVPIHLTLHT